MATNGAARGEPRSLRTLLSDLSQQTQRLVRAEADLAKEELADKAKHAGIGSGMFTAAAVLAAYAFAVLIATVILLIAIALPAWAAALIVFVAMVVVIGLLVLIGRAQLKKSQPAKPERTIENLRSDATAVKEGLRR